MNRYRIRRMAERIALEITRNLPQDRFEQELWNLAAIIEEHLFSEMVRLDEAERRAEETEPVSEAKQKISDSLGTPRSTSQPQRG
jgi:hypothetical protein